MPQASGDKRRGYHHGDLRSALIDAAYELISAHGRNGFTLADACRMAGVSTAAPYRHFADRNALVQAVIGRAFDNLADRTAAARDAHPRGSIDAIIAMGQAYVAFVVEDREIYELLWSRHVYEVPQDTSNPASSDAGDPEEIGRRCFGVPYNAVHWYLEAHGLTHLPTLDIAVALWTMVHGTGSLVLGQNIEMVAPRLDVDAMIDTTVRAYLSGLPRAMASGA